MLTVTKDGEVKEKINSQKEGKTLMSNLFNFDFGNNIKHLLETMNKNNQNNGSCYQSNQRKYKDGVLVYEKINNNGNITEKIFNNDTKKLEEKTNKSIKEVKENKQEIQEPIKQLEEKKEEIKNTETTTSINKKVIIAMSGGLDSTTVAYDLLDKGYEVYGIAFKYPSHHNEIELNCYQHIFYDHLISKPKFHNLGIMDVTSIFENMKNCDFIKEDGVIPEGKYNQEGMKSTVVPFRNGIFASILAGLAQDNGCKYIALGIHKNDNCNYKDTTVEFFEAMGNAIKNGTDNEIEIIAPFVNSTKAEIIKRGMELKVPYQITRSCYTSNTFSCGKCGTCNDRLDAFKEAGFEDPIAYENDKTWDFESLKDKDKIFKIVLKNNDFILSEQIKTNNDSNYFIGTDLIYDDVCFKLIFIDFKTGEKLKIPFSSIAKITELKKFKVTTSNETDIAINKERSPIIEYEDDVERVVDFVKYLDKDSVISIISKLVNMLKDEEMKKLIEHIDHAIEELDNKVEK